MIGLRKFVVFFFFFAFVFYCDEEKSFAWRGETDFLFVILSLKVLVNSDCKENLFFSIFHAQSGNMLYHHNGKKIAEEGVKSERHSPLNKNYNGKTI